MLLREKKNFSRYFKYSYARMGVGSVSEQRDAELYCTQTSNKPQSTNITV